MVAPLQNENELDKFMASLAGKDPEEVERYIKSEASGDLDLFEKILPDYRQRYILLREGFPDAAHKVARIESLIGALKDEGIIEIDTLNICPSMQESMQDTTNRHKVVSSALKISELIRTDHSKAVHEINTIYHNSYCGVVKNYLRIIAERIARREVKDEGAVIQVLKEYCNGAFLDLFDCLQSQIKNAISHGDVFPSHEGPDVTFYDKKNNKLPLKMTVSKYSNYSWHVLNLQIAFDIFTGELSVKKVEEVARICAQAKRVIAALDKAGLKLVPAHGKGMITTGELGQIGLDVEKIIKDFRERR